MRLTPAAYAHGLARALPTKVAMARPTGFERADAIDIRIPIKAVGGERGSDRLTALRRPAIYESAVRCSPMTWSASVLVHRRRL